MQKIIHFETPKNNNFKSMKNLINLLSSGFLILSFICYSCKKEVPVLTTSEITQITSTSALCGGIITDEGSGEVTSRGVCWSTGIKPTISDNKSSDGKGLDSFSSNITGLRAMTVYYVRAYATNRVGTGYGMTISFTTEGVADFEGNKYIIINIGNQVWMAENLKATEYNDGTSISLVTDNRAWISLTSPGYCWYNNDQTTNKYTYGALYNWYAVSTGMLCPTGWHIPGDADWSTLITYLGGENIAGGKLKESGTLHWLSPNSGATNENGFMALPSGDRIGADGSFYNINGYAIYWSSDQSSFTQAIDRVLVFNDTNFRIGYDNMTAGFSIRCIKDN